MTAVAADACTDVGGDPAVAGECAASPAASMNADGSSNLACFSNSSIDAWSISASAEGSWPAAASPPGLGFGVALGGCSAIGHHPWRANARALVCARPATANERTLEICAARNARGHEHRLNAAFTE